MTLARTLPVELAPRFAKAPRVVVRSKAASFEAVAAESFLLRLRGLSGLGEAALVPLLFPRCRSLHTFGMRTAIDIVWLEVGSDGEATVLATEASITPRRFVRAPGGTDRRRITALELPAGDAETLGLVEGAGLTLRS